MASPRSLLLPVETLNREFDGKLLLGLHAVENGWRVVLGHRDSLHRHLPDMEPSIYFSKGFRSGNRRMFQIVAGLGHPIVALDEEGLVPISDEIMLLKMDKDVLSKLRMAFVWGDDNVRLYSGVDDLKTVSVIPTGNPRIDLMRPELRLYFDDAIAGIRQRFGRFALFNSNFAMVNHFIPEKTRFKVADWVPEERRQTLKSGVLAHKADLFKAFRALIPKLAEALGDTTLVIRPHPSENRQPWIDATKGLDNVHVVHEGSVVPWLAAADVLIHNGCTSAVEASIIGTPALAYRPISSDEFDPPLPNRLSREFTEDKGIISAVVDVLGKKKPKSLKLDAKRRSLLSTHVCGLEGALACERIMYEIERHGDVLRHKRSLPDYISARARHVLRTVNRNVSTLGEERHKKNDYASHKFPQIPECEVTVRIERFKRALGKFGDVRTRQLKPSLFSLTR
jgi:surface carbohydrate biosynthesis protein